MLENASVLGGGVTRPCGAGAYSKSTIKVVLFKFRLSDVNEVLTQLPVGHHLMCGNTFFGRDGKDFFVHDPNIWGEDGQIRVQRTYLE
jgi:hypothetical protein